MITELAEIDVKPGHEADFEAAVSQAARFYMASQGCLSLRLHRSLEQPTRYRLIVRWKTLEDHMIEFRNSDAFLQWRRLASPHFANTPRIEHLVCALDSADLLDEARQGA
jgi:quinol monooxygenase YgiN